MARIRSVKPAFYTDEELNDLPLEAHFLYGGLFCQADLEGRLEDKPRTIKLAVFPFRDVDVEPLLDTLAKPKGGRADGKPFILRYAVGPTRIIQIVEFKKHQRITGKEADGVSVFPAHPDWDTMGKQWGITGDTSETTGRERGTGREKEGEGNGERARVALPVVIPDDLKAHEKAILNWLAYKRERGQTYKPKGLPSLWTLLRKIPAEKRDESIEHSMGQNWSGIFEKKGGGPSKGPGGSVAPADKYDRHSRRG